MSKFSRYPMELSQQTDIIRAEEYTVCSWLTTWYELYAKPNIRASTAEGYRRNIESHVNPRIGNIKLSRLTGRDLQWLYKDLMENGRIRKEQKKKVPGLSSTTVRGSPSDAAQCV